MRKGSAGTPAVAKKSTVRTRESKRASATKPSAGRSKRVTAGTGVEAKKAAGRQQKVTAGTKGRGGKSTARLDRSKRSTSKAKQKNITARKKGGSKAVAGRSRNTAPSPARQVLASPTPAAGAAASPNAQFDRALRYYFGEGVRMDKKEAARWFTQAARQGHAEAQSNLGWIYAQGEGVAVNKAEAARWWKKAAAQGDSLARHNLDVLCRDNPAACK